MELWRRAVHWFVPISAPEERDVGRLVLEATASGRETVRPTAIRFAFRVLLGAIGIAIVLLSRTAFLVAFASIIGIETLLGWSEKKHDLRFYERAVYGHFREDSGRRRTASKKMVHRYEDIREIALDRDGRLAIQVRDPRSFEQRTFHGAVPNSKRALVAEVATRLQGSRRELRLPDFDPREWPPPADQRSGW